MSGSETRQGGAGPLIRESVLAPTAARQRHEFLDVLRGFALAGVALSNMVSHSLYLYLPEAARARASTAATDGMFDFLELVFIESKFYTIFSILFGVGFSMLLSRAAAKPLRFQRFFLRRMALLFVMGLAHAVFFWHNDILAIYAICGALLLPFVRRSNRTVLLAAAAALLLPAVVSAAHALPYGTFAGPGDWMFARFGFTGRERVDIWAHGSLPDILRLNASAWFGQVDYVVTSGMIFRIYGCFLLGFSIGRNGIHQRLERHATSIARLAIAGLAIGLPFNILYAKTFSSGSWPHVMAATLGILPLSAAYASSLALVWVRTHSRFLLGAFAPVGRMALSNYVGQSVICALIFKGVGLGLGGHMGPTLYLPLGLAIYMAQIPVSRFWLARFEYGPLEWLWRALTYGRWIPSVKRAVTAP